MSTPVNIPTADRKAVATVTAALVVAAEADGTDELAVLCNALQHHVHEYVRAVRGTRPDPLPTPEIDVLGARNNVESALRVLTQDVALSFTTDPGVQGACDALLWRLRSALSHLGGPSR